MPRVLVSVLLLLVAAPAAAQRPVAVAVSAGIDFPIQPTGVKSSPGYHLQGALQLRLPFRSLVTRAEVGYHQLDERASLTDSRRVGVWAYTLTAVYLPRHPREGATGYFFVGPGYYTGEALDRGNGDRGRFGVTGGGGMLFPVRGLLLFGEIRIHRIGSSGDLQLLPVSFGLLF